MIASSTRGYRYRCKAGAGCAGLRRDTPDVDRTAEVCAVVALVTVDADRIAPFTIRPDRERIAGERYRPAEIVIRFGVGCLEVCLRELGTGDPERGGACVGGYGGVVGNDGVAR